MPPRPFPLPYNIGVDIAQSTRFQKYINHCSSQKNVTKTRPIYRLLEKLMTPPEQRDFWMKYRSLSWIKHHKRKMACTAHIAGRWAAKESIIKAHSPTRQLYMRDILIRTSASTGAPYGIVLDTRLPNTSSPEQIHAEVFASLQASRARSGDYTDPPATDSSATGPEQKSILSETGVLDVEAVEEALKRDEEREVGVEVGRGGDREGRRWEEEEAEVQGQVVRVSISHDGEYAVGMCMAPVMDLVGDVGGEAAARMEGL